MTSVLFLSRKEAESLLKMGDVLKYAEEGFASYGQSSRGLLSASFSPMVAFHTMIPNSDIDYRAGAMKSVSTLCSTLGFGYGDNPAKHGLPSIHALAVLTDLQTGLPVCVMDGYYLSYMRTAAAAAVASKFLAKSKPTRIGLIGAGSLGRLNLEAHMAQYGQVESVTVWSRTRKTLDSFVAEVQEKFNIAAKPVTDAQQAVEGNDVIYCATRSREPVVMDAWVGPGTHINAFGSDSPGKQEVDPRILRRAKIVVDSLEQCKIGGQINKPISQGLITEADVYAELGEIVNGWKKGRTDDREITVMDSTGLAAHDVITFNKAYEAARSKGIGMTLEF